MYICTHTYIYIYIMYVCVCISPPYIYAEDGTIDLLTIYVYIYDSHNLQCCVYAFVMYDICSLNFNVCHAIVLLIV